MREYKLNDYIIKDAGWDDAFEVEHDDFIYKNEEFDSIFHRVYYPTVGQSKWLFDITYCPKDENKEPIYKSWELSDEEILAFKIFIRVNIHPENLVEDSESISLKERKMMIDAKLKKDDEAKQNEAARKATAIENYMNIIREWKPRIDDLIELANYAKSKNISLGESQIGNSNRECYECGYFWSNGITHLVGFINGNKINRLGIIAGGACGIWDFYTDGDSIYEADGKGNTQEPQLYHLEKFVKNFPVLEEEFYKYIDRVCK